MKSRAFLVLLTHHKEVIMELNSIADLFAKVDYLEDASKELAETTERLRRNIMELRDISVNTLTNSGATRLKDLEKYIYNDAKDILYFGRGIKRKAEQVHGILDN